MTLHASRHSRVVLVAATFMLGATTLVAQPQGRVRFDDMDLNRDGVITRDEWRGNDRDFRASDLNRDGVVDIVTSGVYGAFAFFGKPHATPTTGKRE